MDYKYYIDTLQMREQIFFLDGGVSIRNKSYSGKRMTTGLEYNFIYTANNGDKCKEYTIHEQTQMYGARLYKTDKKFVNEYGFHLQIKCSPALARQQVSKVSDKDKWPIRCDMILTIPSLLELYKTEHWDRYLAGSGNNTEHGANINGYIRKYIDFTELKIMSWDNVKSMENYYTVHKAKINEHKYLTVMDMELSQMDFCVNTKESNVNTLYNLLKYVGEYGSKNMKLYHNNTEAFDAEYTVGNYKDRDALVTRVSNNIMTKANGLEFRRGAKSSQIVKFYDVTRKARQYQYDYYLPVYVSRGDKQAIDSLNKYYGKSIDEIQNNKSTLRYEVSIRNVIGGNKGVRDVFKKQFNVEEKKITMKHLFTAKYGSIVSRVLREYLYNIFGDEITKDKQGLGGRNMDKWQLIDKEGFSKGLQIMAILQLMDGDAGMTIGEIKKKFITMGVSYESVRRLMKHIKSKKYASNWDNDRVIAMNLMKDVYSELERVS